LNREFSCVDAQSDDDGSWVPIVKQNKINDVLVKDVCRATAAAPTYFPPAYFTVPSTEDTYDYTDDATDDGTDDDTEVTVEEEEREEKEKKEDPPSQAANKTRHFNMIDGGIAANNPVGFSSGSQSGLFSSIFYQ